MRVRGFIGVVLAMLSCSPLPAIVISEVMYHPQRDEAHGEYVEIYNENASNMDLSRWQFSDGIHYTFPEGTVLNSHAYLVIARDPTTLMTSYGITNVVGPCTGALNNASDHIILRDPAGGVMAEVDYQDSGKWPVAADGAGHSLSKFYLRGNSMDPDNWRASPRPGGTPGRDNGFATAPISGPVVINEVNFHTSGSQFIELYNRSNSPVNIGRFYLSNDPDNLRRFQISTGTMIGAYGRLAFTGPQLGFAILSQGERILLTSPTANIVVEARAVEAGLAEMSEGRWPDGDTSWYYMNPTTGTANVVALTTSVVINEIMYNPPTGFDADQYVELYNAGATTVSLTGWKFSRGINYHFTTGTVIGPGRYLVIAKDPSRLIARYGLSPFLVLGPSSGTLSHGDEQIRLLDANGNEADEVHYYDGGHWPEFADGFGSSLELIDPRQDNNNYQAWAASDETGKAQWKEYWWGGTFSPPTNPELQEIQINLMGAGVALIDDVKITTDGTTNYINETFESGAAGWTLMGNHVQSQVIAGNAHGGAQSLKVVSTGRGDTGANHIERDATSLMPAGSRSYTISFWAKWQGGNRVISARILGSSGNEVPETVMLDVPMETGTPGAQNSVYRPNLGPVFKKVVHSPVIPNGATSVQITAKAYDPDGIGSVTLNYKADSDAAYLTTPMYDDGLHGDGAAGDGIYGGLIPPRAASQTVAFYLRGVDGLAAANTWPTNTARPALYRVASAPLSHAFPKYRMVMTAADENLMYNSRPHLSNEELNCTFIYDETEVYYNCGVRFVGSPFHRAGTGYTGLKVTFPNDDKLHGFREEVRTDNQGGASPTHDRMSYQLQRWMGLPSCPQEWCYVVLNGRENRVLEDIMPPGPEYLDRFYRGDSDGYLFEVDDRFSYTRDNDLDLSAFSNTDARFTWSGSDKDLYRHNYEVRNHGNEDDYTSIILMLNVLNNMPDAQYDATVAQVINVEQWFKLFAIRACISDWDFIAFTRGKNCYLYWPTGRGRWDVLGWDSELTFGQANMSIWSSFAPINRFQRRGRHLHFYYTYLQEMLDKYFTHGMMDSWLDYWQSQAGGTASSDKTFVTNRRNYLLPLIPTAPVNITTNGGNPITVTSHVVTLQGTAPVAVRWVRVAGTEYYLDWTGATNWVQILPVPPGTNVLTLEFLNYDKVVVGTDSIIIIAPLSYSLVTINNGAAYTDVLPVNLTITATGTLPMAQMRFSNDGTSWTAWEPYGTSKSWTLSAGDGVKTVWLQVMDSGANVWTPGNDTIVLDTLPPSGSVMISFGAAATNNTVVALSIFASDAGTGLGQMRFSNDGSNWTAWELYSTGKMWLLPTGDGTKTVYIQFTDKVSHVSAVSTDTIVLDTTGPTGTIEVNGGAAWTSSTSVNLTMSATDTLTGVTQRRLSNNGTAWITWEAYSPTRTWPLFSGDGLKTVYVQYMDAAFNVSAAFTDTISLDTLAPTGSVTINGGAAKTNSTTVTLTLSAADSGAGVSSVRFSNDGAGFGAWEPYAAARTWYLTTGDGLKTVFVQFMDALGNSSSAFSDTITLDTAPPPTGAKNWAPYR